MFETQDLYLAAALQMTGHKMLSLGSENRRATFSFEDGVKQDVADFYVGELKLPALAFSEAIRRMKAAAMNAPERL